MDECLHPGDLHADRDCHGPQRQPADGRVALGLFSTAIAVCILLITAHDRPFIGQNAVQPTVLLQVQPDVAVENTGR